MRQLPSAAEAAMLIALCAKRKETEAGKEFSRIRISEKAFERLTRRRRIDGRFVSDLNEALLDENLLLVFTGDALGLLKASAVKGWPRMTSDRLNEELRLLRRGTLDFDDIARELDGEGPEDEEDDETEE
jgi:hypothetical protein